MNPQFDEQFQALVQKFAELLTGDASPETVQKITYWSIYNHIHKTMPALASHWNQHHPEGKADVRQLFVEIRQLNQQKLKAEQEAPAPSDQ